MTWLFGNKNENTPQLPAVESMTRGQMEEELRSSLTDDEVRILVRLARNPKKKKQALNASKIFL